MGIFSKAKERIKEVQAEREQAGVELKAKQLQAVTLVGEQYPCRKDKKKKRRDAEKGIRQGSKVTLERYTYKGDPAYMVVNPANGLDIGVISQHQAKRLAGATKAKVIQGEIVEQYADASGEKHWKVYYEAED